MGVSSCIGDVSNQERKKMSAIRRFRKRSEIQEDEYVDRENEGVEKGRISEEIDESGCDEERVKDQEEREELERNIRERDVAGTRKLVENKAGERRLVARDEVDMLRKYSRQEYVEKRVKRKLEELGDAIEDEEYLFGGSEVSEAERGELRYKRDVYGLGKKVLEEDGDVIGYRIPEAYDGEGGVDQEKRFSVAGRGYREVDVAEKRVCFGEQEAWEEHQIGKARLSFGAKDGKRESDEYQYVFEDQIDFIKAAVMDGQNFDDGLSIGQGKSESEKLQDDRKTLPIYEYRDALLKAVNDHQVLVIVGETGLRKTTQIPQYLHEAGYTKRGKIGCT